MVDIAERVVSSYFGNVTGEYIMPYFGNVAGGDIAGRDIDDRYCRWGH